MGKWNNERTVTTVQDRFIEVEPGEIHAGGVVKVEKYVFSIPPLTPTKRNSTHKRSVVLLNTPSQW